MVIKFAFSGADPEQVALRLESEMGLNITDMAQSFCFLHNVRRQIMLSDPIPHVARIAYIERLYQEIATGDNFVDADGTRLPDMLLYDELMGQLVLLELTRSVCCGVGWGEGNGRYR